MEKKLLLAVVLSILVLLSWSTVVSKFYHIEKQEVTIREVPPTTPPPTLEKPIFSEPKEEVSEVAEERIDFQNQEFNFTLPKATVKEVVFKDYQNYRFSLQQGFWIKEPLLNFKTLRLGTEPTFVYEDSEKKIIKRFIFHNSNYSMGLEIIIKNISNRVLNIDYPLILAQVDLGSSQLASRFWEVVLAQKDKLVRLTLGRDFSSNEEAKFLAIKEHYFCLVIQPTLPGFKGFIQRINHKQAEVGLAYQNKIEAGKELKLDFHIYLGPQKLRILEGINKDWSSVIHYGTFDYISRLLLKLLEFFQKMLHNWGLAIILLSLFIYFLLFPLSLKQMHSMKRMQGLQPKIESLRQQYKDNPQRLNKEIMELYKRERVNPFSGCLPLILQIPIFFALYQSLIRSIELKGAKFLWIKDLSEPDRLIMLAKSLPVIGNEINILPLLMMIIMFWQQKMSMPATSGTSQEQQKLMMVLFPILFGFIFYHMPSGLVLYWFINTLLMFLQQSKIKLQH